MTTTLNSSDTNTLINTTDETAQLKISSDRAVQARDIYYECCKQLAQHLAENSDTFGEVEFDELVKSIPEPSFLIDDTIKKSKKSKKAKTEKKKYTLENWKECDDKELLKKSFKTKDFKDILSANSLPISGNKSELHARVWGITHPDEAPELPKKKSKGRKKKTNSKKADTTSVDDSDDDTVSSSGTSAEDVQTMLDNRTSIHVDSEGFITTETKGSKEYKLVKEKGWVFKESDEEFEFAGLIKDVDNRQQLSSCEAPAELMELFGEE
jgi:hypothetical protein